MINLFSRPLKLDPGNHQPFGATSHGDEVNFVLYAGNATKVQLLLWDKPQHRRPSHIIDLSPSKNRTRNIWHLSVKGLPPRARYCFRVAGDNSIAGNRFDHHKALLDPYARAIDLSHYRREKACLPGDNSAYAARGIVLGDDLFSWGNDKLPHVPLKNTVIYELHVRGFTKHPSSQTTHPGTFAALIEKLPYLKSLGITTIELMPIHAFDDDIPYQNYAGEELINYWGYSQMSFFAIQPNYFSTNQGYYLSEFKKLVKKAHELDLEVILDVVFNHTTEANQNGPTLSWRGIDNQNYYLLSQENKNYYMNFTGCDNTLNCNHPMVAKMIVDSLEYYAREFHLDGFRFDLGAVFYYTNFGFVNEPYVVELINKSPILSQLKLIAEPWDASGLVLEGRFGGAHWLEWSGSWQRRVREWVNFARGQDQVQAHLAGLAPEFVFYHKDPTLAVNYVCAHDGFTLRDTVSYTQKHNDLNGYHNQDGNINNFSCNYGVEGETSDPTIIALRQEKALQMLQLTAACPGAMMILMGDEMWRTQNGNNNPFTQDNEISWLDWQLLEKHQSWWQQVAAIIKSKSQR